MTRYQGSLKSAFDYDPMGRLSKQHSSHLSKDYSVVERNYSYDKIGQLTHITGQTRLGRVTPSSKIANQFKRNHQYQYDKVGRLTKHLLTDFANNTGITEVFAFDPASNRVPVATLDNAKDDKNKQIHKSGRPTELTTHNSYITYTYDSHGRVLYKTKTPLGQDGKPLKQSGNAIVGYLESLQLAYNANHELTKSVTITQKGLNLTEVTTFYQYDAFGRRISKHSQTKEKTKFVNRQTAKILKFPVQQKKTEQSQVNYLWDGNRQLQEQTDTHVFTTIYEQDGFEPVARLVWLQDGVEIAANEPEYQSVWEDEPDPPKIQVYHCHNDHLGTPNELTNNKGEVVWLADYEAWGNTAKVVWREEQLESVQVSSEELQPLRFQGQSFDVETGLHYNRFRYFDPDLGIFTTRDPIGLMGGSNVFQYAPNPIGWVDPWGLSRMPKWMPTIKGYQRQHLIPYSSRNHPIFQRSGRSMNNATNMMYLPVTTGIDPNPKKGLHRGWTKEHKRYNEMVNRELDRLQRRAEKLNWSDEKVSDRVRRLQLKLRKGFHTGRYTCASPIKK